MDLRSVRAKLLEAMQLRAKYSPCTWPRSDGDSHSGAFAKSEVRCDMRNGLLCLTRVADGSEVFPHPPPITEFYKDMARLFQIRTEGAVSTFAYHRLKLLQMKFELYAMVNYDLETSEQNSNPHRDFYNVRKVDTHIHHSAAMNGKHLLRFIKRKVKKSPGDVVCTRDGRPVTILEVFRQLNIEPQDLSLDQLNVLADKSTLHRFDRFNSKYSPFGNPLLRTIFLKTDNEMGGRYLAEITRELLDDLEESKYQHTEWRLSIYGRDRNEWVKLARWVLKHKLSSPNNMWMIQVPRLYSVYKSAGQIRNFQDMLDNIFLPLVDATLDPEGHPEIHEFLKTVSGFDSVDDESKSEVPVERHFSSMSRAPAEWDISDNPSYKYYNFYLQSNLKLLNRFRARQGLSQFNYRPHAGEAGETHHLDTAFLLADGISHGINLRRSMGLQYLFYLCQIPMAQSPCSNNQLFLSYEKHPFNDFFKRGLNVSLSTDDPLMFHQTKEPLMEEYSIVKQLWRLTPADLCELARNSVLQSGFPGHIKEQWLGTPKFMKENMIQRTNVPALRIHFRRRCLDDELHLIESDDTTLEALRAGLALSPKCLGSQPLSNPVSPMLIRPGELPEEVDAECMRSSAQSIEEVQDRSDDVGLLRLRGHQQACSVDMIGELITSTPLLEPRGEHGGLTLPFPERCNRPQTPEVGSQSPMKRRRIMGTMSVGAMLRQCAIPLPEDGFALPRAREVGDDVTEVNTRAAEDAAEMADDPAETAKVVHAFGESGLLSKLLAEHPYSTVRGLATHLCKVRRCPDGPQAVTPSPEVLAAWRLAILNTREYQLVCERCFGQLVHHSTSLPSEATNNGASASSPKLPAAA